MTFTKSGIIIGIALAISAATTVASSATTLRWPTATYTIKNQSSTPIFRTQANCGNNSSNFPVRIAAGEVARVVTRSNLWGRYFCQVAYTKSFRESCDFTIERVYFAGNPRFGMRATWMYPRIKSPGNCFGRVTDTNFRNDGNFDVELKF